MAKRGSWLLIFFGNVPLLEMCGLLSLHAFKKCLMRGGGGDFTVFSREFLNRFPNEESKHWVVIFWSFWNACNLFLHEGVQLHPKQILDNGHRLLADFREANTSLHQVCSQIERIAGQAAG